MDDIIYPDLSLGDTVKDVVIGVPFGYEKVLR
jgi:hypothetical protein